MINVDGGVGVNTEIALFKYTNFSISLRGPFFNLALPCVAAVQL